MNTPDTSSEFLDLHPPEDWPEDERLVRLGAAEVIERILVTDEPTSEVLMARHTGFAEREWVLQEVAGRLGIHPEHIRPLLDGPDEEIFVSPRHDQISVHLTESYALVVRGDRSHSEEFGV